MKPTKEQVEAYKAMVKDQPQTMESMIRDHLEQNCIKFKGNEDKMERCLEYLNGCARILLESKDGEIDNDICYKICRDYFDDEIWKKEDEEKAEQDRLAEEKKTKSKKNKKIPVATSKAALDKMLEVDSTKGDVPVQIIPPKSKPINGQIDLFAALGV